MWNFLIVIIIAIVIWMLNPLAHNEIKPSAGVENKTRQEINQVENDAIQQVNKARQMQQQEQQSIN